MCKNNFEIIGTILKYCLLSFVSLFFINCQDDKFDNDTSESDQGTLEQKVRNTGVEELEKAREFYMKYQLSEFPQTRSGGTKRPIVKSAYFPYIKDNPSWTFYAINQNDTSIVIDVDITDRIKQDYISKENWEGYKKYKQDKYLRSYTRYVHIRYLQREVEDAFYMTIIPSIDYVRNYNTRMRRNTYLHRDKYLSGYVIFHTLYGAFINGWEYKDGKITGKILLPELVINEKNKKQLLLAPIKSSYSVKLKIDTHSHSITRSGEGYDVDGGELGEVVVTPTPNPDPDWPPSHPEWPDPNPDPTPNPDPDPDPPYVVPDDGNDSGGGGVVQPGKPTQATLPANLKKFYDIIRSTLNLNQAKALSFFIAEIQEGKIGEFCCNSLKNIAFKIDPSCTSPAHFITNTGFIAFNGESSMNVFCTCEELMHALQYNVYYNKQMDNKCADFEFEVKVLTDINLAFIWGIEMGTFGMINSPNYNEYISRYESFIKSIAKGQWNETTYIEQYKDLAKSWHDYQKETHTPYGDMTLDLKMEPKAFKELIKLYK